jgi:hypothetical protein
MFFKVLSSSILVATIVDLVVPDFEFFIKLNKKFLIGTAIVGVTYSLVKNDK